MDVTSYLRSVSPILSPVKPSKEVRQEATIDTRVETVEVEKVEVETRLPKARETEEERKKVIKKVLEARKYLIDIGFPNKHILKTRNLQAFDTVLDIMDKVLFLAEQSSNPKNSAILMSELHLFLCNNFPDEYTSDQKTRLLPVITRTNRVLQHTFQILKKAINENGCDYVCKVFSAQARESIFCIAHDMTSPSVWPEIDPLVMVNTAWEGMEYCELTTPCFNPEKYTGPPGDHLSIFQMDLLDLVFSDQFKTEPTLSEDIRSKVIQQAGKWVKVASEHWQFLHPEILRDVILRVIDYAEEYQGDGYLLRDTDRIELYFTLANISIQLAGPDPTIDPSLLRRKRLNAGEVRAKVQYEREVQEREKALEDMLTFIHKARDAGMTQEQKVRFHILYGIEKEHKDEISEALEHFDIATRLGSELMRHRQLMGRLRIRFINYPLSPEKALKEWKKESVTAVVQEPDLYLPLPDKLTDSLQLDIFIKVLLRRVHQDDIDDKGIEHFVKVITEKDPSTGRYIYALLPYLQGKPELAIERLELLVKDPRAKYVLATLLGKLGTSYTNQEKSLLLFRELYRKESCTYAGLEAGRLCLTFAQDIENAKKYLKGAHRYFIQNSFFSEAEECKKLLGQCEPEQPEVSVEAMKADPEKKIRKKSGKRKCQKTAASRTKQQTTTNPPEKNGKDQAATPVAPADTTGKTTEPAKVRETTTGPVATTHAARVSHETLEPQATSAILSQYALTPALLQQVNGLVEIYDFDQAESLLKNTVLSVDDKRLNAQYYQMHAWLLRQRWFHNEYGSHDDQEKSHYHRQLAILNEAKQSSLNGIKAMGLNPDRITLESEQDTACHDFSTREKRTLASLFAELGHVYRRMSGVCFDSSLHVTGSKLSTFADRLNPLRRVRPETEPAVEGGIQMIPEDKTQRIRKAIRTS